MDAASSYRAVWRVHFYAGLIVLPVLVWLATTGALYLYKPELERAIYGAWTERQFPGAPLSLGELTRSAEIQSHGRVTRIERPADDKASWRLGLTRDDGAKRTLFVDPATGIVMGDVAEGGAMATVKELHSLAIAGPVGNTLVEIVAGWAILLCVTGFYLWWPRGRNRAIALRGRPSQRRFWRDFHASVGAITGGIILFLAITGMPWSGQWGGWLRDGINAAGLGRPPAPVIGSSAHHMAIDEPALPWAMRGGAMPGGHDRPMPAAIDPDHAVKVAASRGLTGGLTIVFPAQPGAAWLVSASAVRAGDARVLWVSGADGRVLQDVPAASFGAGARAIEWGVAVHQGQQYGEANRLLMLAGCLGIWLLAISAPILWWKRRFAAPPSPTPAPRDQRGARGLAAIMIVVGAIFPLTGATMLAAFAGERLFRRA